MSFFNYSEYNNIRIIDLANKIFGKDIVKTAMAYTKMQFRDQYQWWDLQDVFSETPPESYLRELQTVPSLKQVALNALKRRKQDVVDISREQNLPVSTVDNMVKTYIGFHPSYGAYCTQLGPYTSEGFWHGKDHVVEQAMGRFGYFPLRYTRATPQEIGNSLLQKIDQYKRDYNVDLDPSDFELEIKEPAAKQKPGAGKTKMQRAMDPINLDPHNARFRRMFNMDIPDYEPCPDPQCGSDNITVDPGVGEGGNKRAVCNVCGRQFDAQPTPKGLGPMVVADSTMIKTTVKGYEKILKATLGDFYDKTLAEIAVKHGLTPSEISQRALTDPKVLNSIYTLATKKYQNAVDLGQVAELGMPPPKPKDRTLLARPGRGSISPQKIPRNEGMLQQLELVREILDHVYGNQEKGLLPTDDLDEIATRMNQDPVRVKLNQNRERANLKKRQVGEAELPLALFSADGIQIYIDMIDTQREKIGEGATKQQVLDELQSVENNLFSIDPETGQPSIEKDPVTGEPVLDKSGRPKKVVSYGFDDLKTAYQMCKLYYASIARDPISKAHVGPSNASSFDVPANFKNYTMHDLSAARQAAPLTDEQRQLDPAALEKEIGLPEAGRQLVDPRGEEVPLEEGEDEIGALLNPAAPAEELPVPEVEDPLIEEEKRKERIEDIIGTTVKNLIKIASELDDNGKDAAAEEIHKIIRKYQARVF